MSAPDTIYVLADRNVEKEQTRALYMCTLSDVTMCQGNSTLFSFPYLSFKIQDVVTYVYLAPRLGCQLFVSRLFDGKFTEIALPYPVHDCYVRSTMI